MRLVSSSPGFRQTRDRLEPDIPTLPRLPHPALHEQTESVGRRTGTELGYQPVGTISPHWVGTSLTRESYDGSGWVALPAARLWALCLDRHRWVHDGSPAREDETSCQAEYHALGKKSARTGGVSSSPVLLLSKAFLCQMMN